KPRWFRSRRTWLRALRGVSPTCLGRIVFTCVADWLSRTRLLQTTPRGVALTLCFLFFHGLTMQDFHPRYNKRFMARAWTPFEGDFVAYAFPGLKPWAILFSPFGRLEHSA